MDVLGGRKGWVSVSFPSPKEVVPIRSPDGCPSPIVAGLGRSGRNKDVSYQMGSKRKVGPYPRGKGGAYVETDRDGCKEGDGRGKEPYGRRKNQCPPFFDRNGGCRGSSAPLVHSYRKNVGYTGVRCTPYQNTQRKATDPSVRSKALPFPSSQIHLPLV